MSPMILVFEPSLISLYLGFDYVILNLLFNTLSLKMLLHKMSIGKNFLQ